MFEVSHLKKSFQQEVLTDVSISIEQGDCVGILGENGCGKSTLLEIMAGALKADKGDIKINGNSAFQDRKLFSEFIAYVPQCNPLIEELSVKDNLLLWYCMAENSLEQDLKSGTPAMLGLDKVINQKTAVLSGGMKKRLSIACALACHGSILLLDEPSAALDLICKAEIQQYLCEYLKNGGTVVMTTHEESELSLCNRLCVLKNGYLQDISKEIRGKQLIEVLKGGYFQ